MAHDFKDFAPDEIGLAMMERFPAAKELALRMAPAFIGQEVDMLALMVGACSVLLMASAKIVAHDGRFEPEVVTREATRYAVEVLKRMGYYVAYDEHLQARTS